jgi:hypothetical protein
MLNGGHTQHTQANDEVCRETGYNPAGGTAHITVLLVGSRGHFSDNGCVSLACRAA